MSRKPTGTPVLLTGIVRAGCCSALLHPASNAAQANIIGQSGDFESPFIASPPASNGKNPRCKSAPILALLNTCKARKCEDRNTGRYHALTIPSARSILPRGVALDDCLSAF